MIITGKKHSSSNNMELIEHIGSSNGTVHFEPGWSHKLLRIAALSRCGGRGASRKQLAKESFQLCHYAMRLCDTRFNKTTGCCRKTGSTKLKITHLLQKCTQKTGEWFWTLMNLPIALQWSSSDPKPMCGGYLIFVWTWNRPASEHPQLTLVICRSVVFHNSWNKVHFILFVPTGERHTLTYTNIICIETVPATKGSCSQSLYFGMCSVDLCGTAYCKFAIPKSKTWTPKKPQVQKVSWQVASLGCSILMEPCSKSMYCL